MHACNIRPVSPSMKLSVILYQKQTYLQTRRTLAYSSQMKQCNNQFSAAPRSVIAQAAHNILFRDSLCTREVLCPPPIPRGRGPYHYFPPFLPFPDVSTSPSRVRAQRASQPFNIRREDFDCDNISRWAVFCLGGGSSSIKKDKNWSQKSICEEHV